MKVHIVKNEYPLSALVSMVLVFASCSIIGFFSGYTHGEIIGMGAGAVLGMALCIMLAAEERGREESVWRQNMQTQARLHSMRNSDPMW